ncbi:helix-turn-helix domain-containing protein [Georgenia wangjunii]|uniref:helix-turn-helix domain-containing protein n=1 Tax=Georgenia wangjunii TaxID=3117730 RepID=UPI003D9C6787
MSTHAIEEGTWIPEWTLADRLRKARQSTGLRQREFAEKLEVGAPAYAQWESGNNQPRDIVTLARRIEMLTSIPATWILGLNEERPRPAGSGARGGMLPRLDSNQQPSD